MTFALAVLAILQGIFTVLESRRSARHVRTFRPAPRSPHERIAVFCPCKGTDAEFGKNIRSILEQDYGNYETHFIVESSDDPAYTALRHLGISNILVAGRATDRGQKVHNLAYGVTRAGHGAAIYVFCDSDARFPHSWLSKLTAALDATNITTGYRWYTVRRANLPTLMRSAWNASSLGVLGGHDRNFAWGGSMAIYRQAFERLDILRAWFGAVSDDYAITNAAHREGMKIVFIPECLIPTYGECTWRELFEFTTRQIVITRVYHRRLWRVRFSGSRSTYCLSPITGRVIELFKPLCRSRRARPTVGSISCVHPWWPCCIFTIWSLRRCRHALCGGRYTTGLYLPIKRVYSYRK